ncbi:HK97 gp10 family phage protein [Shouchella miscanthi]|uniref:HK97 gp10 family phage protein n=1 Tax=Shouchella miscanthi TaxID=2598861 RepID=UPI00119D4CD1|nr:HK97 gp10 family phage protein [Shouchella miscanthi]
MARRDFMSVQWRGLKELEKEFKAMPKRFERAAIQELGKYSALLEEGAKALVHHDEGDLEDSISFDPPKKKGQGFEFEGGSSSKYALVRHYQPYRMGVHDKMPGDNYYVGGRGRRTHNKPAWRGERAGRLYLERAIRVTDKDFQRTGERILERTMDRRGRK